MSSIKSFRYSMDTIIHVEETPEGHYSYYEREGEDGIFCNFSIGPSGRVKPEPRYEHHRKDNGFLGFYKNDDLYLCEQGSDPTLIIRHSSKWGDYKEVKGLLKKQQGDKV